jgi:formylmethanofuran dehydrogenase subunit B
MAGIADSALRRNVACPFCGLVCDDLTVAVDGGAGLAVRAAGCGLSREAFGRRAGDARARLAGRTMETGHAVARAAAILARSRQPLFAGLGTDVDGMRAVLLLAERTGGIVDHFGSDGLFRNLRVVQDSGWVTTTLAEVRNHMDVMLIVGPDPTPIFPRFLELGVVPAQTLYEGAAPARRVFRLGPPTEGDAERDNGVAVIDLPCPLERLPEAVASLRCLINERGARAADTAGPAGARLQELAEALKSARYGVVTWMAGALDFAGSELLTQSLADMVRDLNRSTRCAAIPLTGSDNVLGVNQVCTWQSGVPLRSSFGSGLPQHDSCLYKAGRLLANREVDALVWISAFRPVPPPVTDVPTIALVTADTPFARPPDIVIPVGTPGVDHAGQVFRTDGVVAIQLTALRVSPLPSVADILARIAAARGTRR